MGFDYLDTGAMYRAISLKLVRAGVDLDNTAGIGEILEQTKLSLTTAKNCLRILLDGEDVTSEIREPHVNRIVSEVSCIPGIRRKMVALQREIARRSQGIVVEGRDICSKVLPEATHKIYLDAALSERARRRWKEQKACGMKVLLSRVKEEISKRDRIDSEREDSPLSIGPGVLVLDTTEMSPGEVVDKIVNMVNAGGTALEGD